MCGYNVLHPMGWDAFGLPAEQVRRRNEHHPRITTGRNIDTFRRQNQMLGFSYDWIGKSIQPIRIISNGPQWIFLQLYDTWYDVEGKRGRPMPELPIPDEGAHTRNERGRAYQGQQAPGVSDRSAG